MELFANCMWQIWCFVGLNRACICLMSSVSSLIGLESLRSLGYHNRWCLVVIWIDIYFWIIIIIRKKLKPKLIVILLHFYTALVVDRREFNVHLDLKRFFSIDIKLVSLASCGIPLFGIEIVLNSAVSLPVCESGKVWWTPRNYFLLRRTASPSFFLQRISFSFLRNWNCMLNFKLSSRTTRNVISSTAPVGTKGSWLMCSVGQLYIERSEGQRVIICKLK